MIPWLKDKRVLVTGGTGAFGRKFVEGARAKGVGELTLLSRDEMKHAALRRDWGAKVDGSLRLVIGDVAYVESLLSAMRGVDCVIHAAAMKHLPECEFNPTASTRVNIIGTCNVLQAFLQSRASTLIFLSTDKAPYASSVYGAQKYLGEKLVAEASRAPTGEKRAYSLRYSNVMDSTGSVLHVFNQLLISGRTAVVNGSRTYRGFVSQSQVLSCLDDSLQVARGGEVFVPVPQVVRIAELAETMHGLIGRGQVEVTESSSFVGEKESATLVMAEEAPIAKEFPEYRDGRAILLDPLGRHPERMPAALGPGAFSLDDCPRLTGAELKRFVSSLM